MVLWIISGPSSAGKSHLLASARARELTSLDDSTQVLFPAKLGKSPKLDDDAYLHYNLLRPAQAAAKSGRDPATALDFTADERWMRVVNAAPEMKAIILVADEETLKERAGGRSKNEPGSDRDYKQDKWLSLYEQVDLDAIYAAWRQELATRGVPYVEVDSTQPGFPELGARR